MAWKPSGKQMTLLRALDGRDDMTAAALGTLTHQSSDGAAYTLRSLVNRGLVGRQYGEASRYRLTDAGREVLGDAREAGSDGW